MSIMRKPSASRVAYFERGIKARATNHHLKDCCFEAQGDAVWFPGKYLIIAGYGNTEYHRTDQKPSIRSLPSPDSHYRHPPDPQRLHHLNTTLCLVSPETCVVYPGGVAEGVRILRQALSERY